MTESVTIFTPSGPIDYMVGKNGVSKIIPRRDGKSVWMMINGKETEFSNVTFSATHKRSSGVEIVIMPRN